MSKKKSIKNLNDLKLAKLELKADIIQNEMAFEMEWNELKRFDFSSGQDILQSKTAKSFIQSSSPLILESLSNLVIDKVIKPESKTSRKLMKQVSDFLILQAEPYLEEKLS